VSSGYVQGAKCGKLFIQVGLAFSFLGMSELRFLDSLNVSGCHKRLPCGIARPPDGPLAANFLFISSFSLKQESPPYSFSSSQTSPFAEISTTSSSQPLTSSRSPCF